LKSQGKAVVPCRYFQSQFLNDRFHRYRTFNQVKYCHFERQLWVDTVEKLCFEKSGDFICDLNGIAYCMYEGVAEVV